MKRTLLTALLVLSVTGVDAQITLESCREKARAHYPETRQYDLVEQTRRLTFANAAKAWLPQVVAGAQATWQNAVTEYPETLSALMAAQGMEITGMRKDQYKLSLQVDQTLWDGGQTRSQQELADAQAREQSGRLDVDLYALEKRVDDLFFGILMLDNRIGQTEAMIRLLDSNWEQARAMVRRGVATQSDADILEAERLSAGQTLSSLETTRDTYRRVLSLLIGEELPGTLVRPRMPAPRTGLRPELALLEAKAGVLAAQESQVRSSVLPRLSLFAQGWYGYPGLDMLGSMTSTDWTWNAVVGVRMMWNVSALYTHGNRLAQIQAARQQAQVQKDLFLFDTRLQAVGLEADLDRLQRIAAGDERIVELRRNVRAAAEARFRSGTLTATELLKAISDETRAAAEAEGHALELLKTAYESRHNQTDF